jgi:SAM-dependent methyltransferase
MNVLELTEQKKSWYETWFNTPYYHALYQHRDQAEAERMLDGLLPRLGLGPSAKIIDLGCGRGRHARYLSTFGFDVTGIDISQANIQHAQQFETDTLRFAVHDMHDPYLEASFDAALNLFTSFGYDECDDDNYAIINSAAQCLKPGGIFVLDYLNTERYRDEIKTAPYHLEIAGVHYCIYSSVTQDFIVKNIEVTDRGNAFHFYERIRNYSYKDFEHCFSNAGLSIQKSFGTYSFSPFRASTAERMIILAKKTDRP